MGSSAEGGIIGRFMRFFSCIVRMDLREQPRGHEVTLAVPG
jgi:hypothetical protein